MTIHKTPRSDAPALIPVPGEKDEIIQWRKLLYVDAHVQTLLHKLSDKTESHAPHTLYQ